MWNLSGGVPVNSLKVETDIQTNPDLFLDYIAYSDMTFSQTNVYDFVRLMNDGQPIVPTTATNIDIYTSSDNLNYFSMAQTTFPVTLLTVAQATPVLSLISNTRTVTTMTLTLSTTAITLVYYQIQLTRSSLAFDFTTISENVRQKKQYAINDVNQVQYGMIPVYVPATAITFTFNNLLSNREYIVKLFP